jgi:hypothetical protein
MAKSSERIATPQAPALKPNYDIPRGVPVQRQPAGAPNSANEAGSEVPRGSYSK